MLVTDVTPLESAPQGTMARRPIHAAVAVAFAVAFAFTLAPSALAQSTTSAPTAPAKPVPTPSIQGYGDHDKTCTSWTDGCVSCRIDASNAVACSNTGIACQPQAIACVVRRQEPAKEPPKQPSK